VRRARAPAPPGDAARVVRAEGLRYVSDSEPGIRRIRRGRGFVYVAPDGRRVSSAHELARIRALAIPPAYRDVWICPIPEGHIQATGRDARGRKQYRYHPRWRAHRDATKFDRMLEFAHALPRIRRRVAADLRRPGLPREKVLAAVVQLLESTLVRVGNEEYVRANGSFGLTTLRDDHVDVTGATVSFEFRGKSGIVHRVRLEDPAVARIVRSCRDIPGQVLFQWVDADGERRRIDSEDVNEYLREAGGGPFTAKDYRTWFATLEALRCLQTAGTPSARQAKRRVNEIVARIAHRLGNTPTVCRNCYVHPRVIEAFLDGRLNSLAGLPPRRALHRLLRSPGRRAAVRERVRAASPVRALHDARRPATTRSAVAARPSA